MAEKDEEIVYGIHSTEIGEVVLARSSVGICWLGFMVPRDGNVAYKENGLDRLMAYFAGADIVRDDVQSADLMAAVLGAWKSGTMGALALDLRGTVFQREVWDALLAIPQGEVCTYGDIARVINRPKAARAVGSAVGENPVSLIVPCHRVVQQSGAIGHYGWGSDIKRHLLLAENVTIAA